MKLTNGVWMNRLSKISNILISRSNEEDTQPALMAFTSFLASLSCFSSKLFNKYTQNIIFKWFSIEIETSTVLAYGGATNWIKNELNVHTPMPLKKYPKTIQLLLNDQNQRSFTSLAIITGTRCIDGISPLGTNLSSDEESQDPLLSYSLITLAELSRHSM